MNGGKLSAVLRTEIGRRVLIVATVTNLVAVTDLVARHSGRDGLRVVLAPIMAHVLFWTLTLGLVALALSSLIAVTRRRPFGALVAVSCAVVPGLVWAQTRAYQVARSVGDVHGEYALLWQGSTVSWVWTIAEVQEDQGFRCLVRGIAWDEGGGICMLVRPKPAATLQRLTRAPDGTLLATNENGICWLAVNPATGVVHDSSNMDDLSPFLLLGDDGEGVIEDVDRLRATIRASRAASGATAHPAGVPSDATLNLELRSPNPWVRNAARELLAPQ